MLRIPPVVTAFLIATAAMAPRAEVLPSDPTNAWTVYAEFRDAMSEWFALQPEPRVESPSEYLDSEYPHLRARLLEATRLPRLALPDEPTEDRPDYVQPMVALWLCAQYLGGDTRFDPDVETQAAFIERWHAVLRLAAQVLTLPSSEHRTRFALSMSSNARLVLLTEFDVREQLGEAMVGTIATMGDLARRLELAASEDLPEMRSAALGRLEPTASGLTPEESERARATYDVVYDAIAEAWPLGPVSKPEDLVADFETATHDATRLEIQTLWAVQHLVRETTGAFRRLSGEPPRFGEWPADRSADVFVTRFSVWWFRSREAARKRSEQDGAAWDQDAWLAETVQRWARVTTDLHRVATALAPDLYSPIEDGEPHVPTSEIPITNQKIQSVERAVGWLLADVQTPGGAHVIADDLTAALRLAFHSTRLVRRSSEVRPGLDLLERCVVAAELHAGSLEEATAWNHEARAVAEALPDRILERVIRFERAHRRHQIRTLLFDEHLVDEPLAARLDMLHEEIELDERRFAEIERAWPDPFSETEIRTHCWGSLRHAVEDHQRTHDIARRLERLSGDTTEHAPPAAPADE